MGQINLYEIIRERFEFSNNHKIKLFEAFSGIGCQRMAFERAGLNYEVVGISEIDRFALKSYEAMHGECPNYGSITDIHQLPEIDVFTWSFPCTDLSKAGRQAGLNGTRSGLVYEVLRILNESQNKPKVLIMENVVDLVQQKFIREFNEIQRELELLGYSNYTQTLNAKEYGVAQNRDRVFMVSFYGEYYYEFPEPITLEKRLKDYLEKNVDEKYYLSKQMLSCFTDMTDRNGLVRGDRFNPHGLDDSKYAFAITTMAGNRATDNFIKEPIICASRGRNDEDGNIKQTIELNHSGLSNALTTVQKDNYILVPEATTRGYAEAYDGDGVYINRPHQKRGVVQSQMIQTLKTSGSDVGVVVYEDCNSSIRTDQDTVGTLTTNYGSNATRNGYKLIENNLRIRKLTPLECWRLMGIDDHYFDKASKVCSNAQLYKQAGNGIVVDVFAQIVNNLVKRSD